MNPAIQGYLWKKMKEEFESFNRKVITFESDLRFCLEIIAF
jgi:hypothetical protein